MGFGWPSPTSPLPKRKVFLSYSRFDRAEVEAFIFRWATGERVFIPKVVGAFDNDVIGSSDPEYVMSQIRQRYIGDSSVTIVLVGSCTHGRRYIDWEIKSSLRQGAVYAANGLAGIILPSRGTSTHLPPRLAANWNAQSANCYARYWIAPTTADEIRFIIEDAYAARTTRAHLIQNSADMMKYNVKCLVCGVTHPA